MRRLAVTIAVAGLVGAGWLAATMVRGEESVNDVKPVAVPVRTTPPAPPNAPAKTEKPAKPEKTVTPPAPIPDVEIPLIRQVGTDPFKPAGADSKTGTGAPLKTESGTPGKTGEGAEKPAGRTSLIEEGKRLFNREGRVELDRVGRTIFVFDSGDKPMRILENSWREYLESVTERAKKKARWRISGVVTAYEQENFLLLTKVIHIMPEEENL